MDQNQYPNLFKITTPASTPREKNDAVDVAPNFLPLVKSEEKPYKSTVIDEALASKLGRDALLRLKAMEYTLEFLGGRTISTPEKIDELYNIFYNKINGKVKQQRAPVR